MTVSEFEIVRKAIEAAWARNEKKVADCIVELQQLQFRKQKESER